MFFGCFKKSSISPKSVKRGILKSTSFKQVYPEPPPQEIKSITNHSSMLFPTRDRK